MPAPFSHHIAAEELQTLVIQDRAVLKQSLEDYKAQALEDGGTAAAAKIDAELTFLDALSEEYDPNDAAKLDRLLHLVALTSDKTIKTPLTTKATEVKNAPFYEFAHQEKVIESVMNEQKRAINAALAANTLDRASKIQLRNMLKQCEFILRELREINAAVIALPNKANTRYAADYRALSQRIDSLNYYINTLNPISVSESTNKNVLAFQKSLNSSKEALLPVLDIAAHYMTTDVIRGSQKARATAAMQALKDQDKTANNSLWVQTPATATYVQIFSHMHLSKNKLSPNARTLLYALFTGQQTKLKVSEDELQTALMAFAQNNNNDPRSLFQLELMDYVVDYVSSGTSASVFIARLERLAAKNLVVLKPTIQALIDSLNTGYFLIPSSETPLTQAQMNEFTVKAEYELFKSNIKQLERRALTAENVGNRTQYLLNEIPYLKDSTVGVTHLQLETFTNNLTVLQQYSKLQQELQQNLEEIITGNPSKHEALITEQIRIAGQISNLGEQYKENVSKYYSRVSIPTPTNWDIAIAMVGPSSWIGYLLTSAKNYFNPVKPPYSVNTILSTVGTDTQAGLALTNYKNSLSTTGTKSAQISSAPIENSPKINELIKLFQQKEEAINNPTVTLIQLNRAISDKLADLKLDTDKLAITHHIEQHLGQLYTLEHAKQPGVMDENLAAAYITVMCRESTSPNKAIEILNGINSNANAFESVILNERFNFNTSLDKKRSELVESLTNNFKDSNGLIKMLVSKLKTDTHDFQTLFSALATIISKDQVLKFDLQRQTPSVSLDKAYNNLSTAIINEIATLSEEDYSQALQSLPAQLEEIYTVHSELTQAFEKGKVIGAIEKARAAYLQTQQSTVQQEEQPQPSTVSQAPLTIDAASQLQTLKATINNEINLSDPASAAKAILAKQNITDENALSSKISQITMLKATMSADFGTPQMQLTSIQSMWDDIQGNKTNAQVRQTTPVIEQQQQSSSSITSESVTSSSVNSFHTATNVSLHKPVTNAHNNQGTNAATGQQPLLDENDDDFGLEKLFRHPPMVTSTIFPKPQTASVVDEKDKPNQSSDAKNNQAADLLKEADKVAGAVNTSGNSTTSSDNFKPKGMKLTNGSEEKN